MIQTHQLQILAVLGQIPVRGDIQLSAICKLDLVHALLDSSDAMPRLLHRSAEESDQSSQARLHVGERFVVIQAEVIQILKQIEHYPARFLRVADRRLQLDRKSTRLNSSHLVISYAVFCLKKKKKPKTRFTPAYTLHAQAARPRISTSV